MILDAAPPECVAATGFTLPSRCLIRSERLAANGRHLVIVVDGALHRLWIRDLRCGQSLAYVIPCDQVSPRLSAIDRFERVLTRRPSVRVEDVMPSAFQRTRLRLLLAIYDHLQSDLGGRPHTYDVARQLVTPRMTLARGSEWKGSSERRRTQRLIAEARFMVARGYRGLLNTLPGGDKNRGR